MVRLYAAVGWREILVVCKEPGLEPGSVYKRRSWLPTILPILQLGLLKGKTY